MAVYFIQNEKGRIKIGTAINPNSRLKELLTSSDEELTLIGTKPGGVTEEKQIQQRFAYAHVVREWFEPVPELLDFIKEETKEVIVFVANNQEFPLEIIDHNGERWVTRKQLAAALGVKDLEHLHRKLIELGELKEKIHWNRFAVNSMLNPKGRIIIYSYQGIIRISTASEGQNAIIFRDWAENVLYKVMTNGSYGESHLVKDLKKRVELIEKRFAKLMPEPVNHLPPPENDPAIEMLVSAWWSEFKDKVITSKDLFPLVDREGIPLKLTAKSERGVQVQFGTIIKKLRDRRFKLRFDTVSFDVTVCKTGIRHKVTKWQLKINDNIC